MSDQIEDDEEWICPEDNAAFIGPCTCEHDPEDHSWGSCDVPLADGSGCLCQAGWEE